MPHVRGVRDYSFFNDDDFEHTMRMSAEEVGTLMLSRVPAYNPATTLAPIIEALRQLAKDVVLVENGRKSGERCEDDEAQKCVTDDSVLADDNRKLAGRCADDEPQKLVTEEVVLADDKRKSGERCADDKSQQFVAEEAVLADDKIKSGGRCDDDEPHQFVADGDLRLSDLIVSVEGVGELQLPLEEITIEKLIGVSRAPSSMYLGDLVSTKALGSMIPATELRVELKEEALNRIVRIIIDSLNIDGKCSLQPRIRCLSIYGPGQFCGPRGGSEREVCSPVRLDVALPCHCEGGDLYIKHGAQNRTCSADSGTVRWTAFYSDCSRWLYEVREGHRVMLTYDVELEYLATSPGPSFVTDNVDDPLNDAVAQHFSSKDRLIVILLHRYSEDTLDWHKIKGRDSTYARALLSVAKRQDLRTSLALGKCLETWETSIYHGPVRNGGSVELVYWLDESGRRHKESVSIDYEGMAQEVCTFHEDLWSLGEPDREKHLGWHGEGPAIWEQWYHKACVVLVKNK